MSRIIDPDDRSTAALFGDGAGAVVVSAGRPRPRSDRPCSAPTVLAVSSSPPRARRRSCACTATTRSATRSTGSPRPRVDAAAAAGTPLDEIDLFVFHQANGRILTAVGERLGLAPDRVVDCIGSYGNTSAATIPLALAEARDAGRLVPGTKVLLAAFGAGLTWAATVVEWGLGEAGADA